MPPATGLTTIILLLVNVVVVEKAFTGNAGYYTIMLLTLPAMLAAGRLLHAKPSDKQ